MSGDSVRIRRRALAALVGLGLTVALAGCGVPDETRVQIDGRGPEADTGSVDGTSLAPPGRQDAGEDAGQFVVNFLRAAAGETTGVYKRVNEYLPVERRHREKPVNEVAINVVRLTEDRPRFTENPSGPSSVSIRVEHVGVLRANGSIGEPVLTDTEYHFTIGKIEPLPGQPGSGNGLYLLDPPPVLLMSTDALTRYYRERMIYFWNPDRTTLVPDLRYLPVSVPLGRQPTEVLSWLVGGPAEWLAGTAVRLPEGTSLIGNVTRPDSRDRVEANLSVKAGELDDETELDQLFTQLAWSLRENVRGELELKIQGKQRRLAEVPDHLSRHPLYQVADTPQPFCVYNGKIHPLGSGGNTSLVPVAAEENRDIRSAALNRHGDQIWAALMVPAGQNWRLRVGMGTGSVSAFAESAAYRTMSRPVWLKSSDPRSPTGLVVADGRLYRFGVDAVLTEVRLPNAPGPVGAVSAALDGHRIAFVSEGQGYVAALTLEGGTVTVGRARRLVTMQKELTVIDWNGENSVVIAGVNEDGWATIRRTTTDGVLESPVIERIQQTKVTHLAAYPDNPVTRSPAGNPMYEGNGVAYAAGERIMVEQATNQEPAGSGNPTAPFFSY